MEGPHHDNKTPDFKKGLSMMSLKNFKALILIEWVLDMASRTHAFKIKRQNNNTIGRKKAQEAQKSRSRV